MSHYTPVTFETVQRIRKQAAAAAAKKKEEEDARLEMEKYLLRFAGVTLVYDQIMAAIEKDPESNIWNVEIPTFKEDARYLVPDIYEPMRAEISRVFPDFAIFQNTREPWKFRFVLAQPKAPLTQSNSDELVL